MSMQDKRAHIDRLVDDLVEKVVGIVQRKGIRCDRRGQRFASSQLDSLRHIFETRGWKTARLYQVGKIDPRDRDFELRKNEALLEIIDAAADSGLDRSTVSYTIGKLNSILADRLGVDSGGGQKHGRKR